jgi:hypothetical protein
MADVQRQADGTRCRLRSLDAARAELARMDLAAMTPAELLAEAAVAGLSVSAEGGRLVVRGPKGAERLARLLLEHKEELLHLVPQAPAWDQSEADRLLGEARAAAARAEVEHRAGRMTEVRRNVVRIWREVAEAYVAGHELEARRAWDALALLRGAVRHCIEAAGLPGTGLG